MIVLTLKDDKETILMIIVEEMNVGEVQQDTEEVQKGLKAKEEMIEIEKIEDTEEVLTDMREVVEGVQKGQGQGESLMIEIETRAEIMTMTMILLFWMKYLLVLKR